MKELLNKDESKRIYKDFDVKLFFISCKAELFKINHFKLLLIFVLITLPSILLLFFMYSTNRDNPNIIGSDAITQIFDEHNKFFLFISFPFILSLISSVLYKNEFENKTKKVLYTFPIPRSTIFYSKLTIALSYIFISLTMLNVIVFFLRNYYMSSWGIYHNFSYNTFFFILMNLISITICAIPLMTIHLWFSSLKLSALWNSLIIIGMTGISVFLYSKYLTNQWYNIYLCPLSIQLNLRKINFETAHFYNWEWFNQHSYPFMMVLTLITSFVLLYLITNYINKKDSKY